MPSKKNVADLEYLKEHLGQAKATVLVDYKGLTVAQVNKLRRQLKALGAEFKVIKNTLLSLGFKAQGYPMSNLEGELTGPTAIVFASEDEISSVKALYEFARENSLPKFKVGFLARDFMPADRLTQLAELPAKEVLLAKLMGTLNAPLTGLMNVMQGNMRKLVYVLEAVKNKQRQ